MLTALALVFSASCQRIEETFVQDKRDSGEKMIFEATIAEATISEAGIAETSETKSALQSNEKDIYWTPGDAINLFYGSSTKSKFTANITEPFPTASFEGDLGAATGSAEQGISSQSFWGVYPYDEDNTCDGNSVTLKILDRQFASPGSFGNGMNPSVANSPGLSLSFYNVGSWFRFSVSHSGITAATFSGNNGEILAGKVTVKMDSNGKPLISDIENGRTSITVTPEGGGSFVPGKYYYITLIPQTIGGTGYTITLFKKGNAAKSVTADPARTYDFARSKYRSKTNVDEDLTFAPEYVELEPGSFWATTNIGASSPEEYGDYFAWGETKPKTEYSWETYLDNPSGDGETFTKYNKRMPLDPQDDAATANWGSSWRMPTEREWSNLLNADKYDLTLTDNYNGTGVAGWIVTSKVPGYEGNQIFLPAAEEGEVPDSPASYPIGHYWSSSFYWWTNTVYNAWQMILYGEVLINTSLAVRFHGYSVRAIYDPSSNNGHKYVDMGQGIYWATTNLGASSPQYYGDYFAWGETVPKSEYTSSNYTATEFQDAATANWGENWRMPTSNEWVWLADNCRWDLTGDYNGTGVAGYVVTASNGNSIFLPFAGAWTSTGLKYTEESGAYWSSTTNNTNPNRAWSEYFDEYDIMDNLDFRYTGLPIRPVYSPKIINGHEYVEMGDGLKWATMNVGADITSDSGDYFAWGETRPKTDYQWSTYFDSVDGGNQDFNKYASDKKTSLDPEDDAAKANWGSSWRMPTEAEWTALTNTDNFTWTWDDTKKGYTVTSKVSGYVGNSIFLPAAGMRKATGGSNVGTNGYYWASSVDLGYYPGARDLYFTSTTRTPERQARCWGMPVRAVSE